MSTKRESASDKWQLQVSSRYASHANHYSCCLPPPTSLPTRRLAYIPTYVPARAWVQPRLRRLDTSLEMSTVVRAPASQRLCSHARVPLPFVYTRQAERSVRHTPLAQDSRKPDKQPALVEGDGRVRSATGRPTVSSNKQRRLHVRSAAPLSR